MDDQDRTEPGPPRRRSPEEAARESRADADAITADADAGPGADAAAGPGAGGPDDDTGLRALLSSPLVAGPDPAVTEEILGQGPEGDDDDGDNDSDSDAAADDAWITGAADRDQASSDTDVAHAQAEEEVRRIYLDILDRAPEHDVQPSLDRVRDVLDLLGDPQGTFPVIHLTGTNGKTTTARMIERLLRERGLRTGRFTSPHLHTVRERIALDGDPIDPERFVAVWEDVAPYIAMVDERSRAAGGPRLSFFEVFTVMAYAAFADAPVDVAVVEVGMGGRWDATNVVDAGIAVLTRVERDHTRWLGHELVEIASEKVGIIADHATVVAAEQHEDVDGVLLAAAAQHGATLLREGTDLAVLDRQLAVGGQLVTLRTPAAVYEDVMVPLLGEHQAHNALLALTAVEAFFGGGALDAGVVEQAFAAVDSPGRLEVVRSSPTVLVDAAHNPAGVVALRAAVSESFDLSHLVGVVGVMADKEVEAILAELEPMLDEIVVTRAPTDRAMDVDDLAEIARDVFGEDRVHVADRLVDAVDVAAGLAESDSEEAVTTTAVLVVGSILLAAEARALLRR